MYSHNHSVRSVWFSPILQGRELRLGRLRSVSVKPQPSIFELRSDWCHSPHTGSEQLHSIYSSLLYGLGSIGALPVLSDSACLLAEVQKQDRCMVTCQDCGTSGCWERTHYIMAVRASVPDSCWASIPCQTQPKGFLAASSLASPIPGGYQPLSFWGLLSFQVWPHSNPC